MPNNFFSGQRIKKVRGTVGVGTIARVTRMGWFPAGSEHGGGPLMDSDMIIIIESTPHPTLIVGTHEYFAISDQWEPLKYDGDSPSSFMESCFDRDGKYVERVKLPAVITQQE